MELDQRLWLPHEPKAITAVVHPYPAQGRRVDQGLADLEKSSQRLGFRLEFTESPRDEEEALKLVTNLPPDTSDVMTFSGDGVNSNMLSAIYKSLRDVRLNPFGGGGACDFARQAHSSTITRFTRLILGSQDLPFRPLIITAEHQDIDSPDHTKEMFASVYWAIGFTARMASIYNSEDFRDRVKGRNPKVRKGIQGIEIFKNINQAETFIVEPYDRPPMEVGEYVFPNGNRMASGVVRFLGNSLFNNQYGEMAVGKINLPVFVKSIGKSYLGQYQKHPYGEVVQFTVKSLDESPITYQADGEVGQIPSGSQIRVRMGNPNLRVATSIESNFRQASLAA